MSEPKYERDKKKQLGQFMTPRVLVKKLIGNREYKTTDKILEPSFGQGSFLIEIIYKLIDLYPSELTIQQKIDEILKNNIYGVEMDLEMFNRTINNIQTEFNVKVSQHNLINDDFFNVDYNFKFDHIEGNPPFGGTFETKFGEKLDKIYGKRDGLKIKKETYSFFTVKCFELLKNDGKLGFVCSDTFLTINTMNGLRKLLSQHTIKIDKIEYFSEETNYGMVYFDLIKNQQPLILIDGVELSLNKVKQTENFSFRIQNDFIKYFTGVTLKKFITCSSGMTIGKNELFLKEKVGDFITENYEYIISQEPKTLEKELYRSKLGSISKSKEQEINDGVFEDILQVNQRNEPIHIKIPNSDYLPYNKATSEKIYSEPKTYIYWKNDGEAVHIFKKTGKWYLHGVGGKPFFKKEGLTWNLISDEIKVRYLPEGYILDSGCPIGVLNEGVDKDELYFIIGWLLSPTSTKILKNVINHTKNIQSKDIERLPYPTWVKNKIEIVEYVKNLIQDKMNSNSVDSDYQSVLDNFYKLQ